MVWKETSVRKEPIRPAVGPGSEPNADGDAAGDRVHDAAAARRVGRDEGREHQVGRRDGIAETQRRPREPLDEDVAHPRSEAGRGDRAGEQEGGEHHPDRDVAESGEHLGGRQGARDGEQGHGDHHADSHLHRLRDQRDDGGDEDRQQMALLRVQQRHREEVQQTPREAGRQPIATRRVAVGAGSFERIGCGHGAESEVYRSRAIQYGS